jgi:hypothetical protein
MVEESKVSIFLSVMIIGKSQMWTYNVNNNWKCDYVWMIMGMKEERYCCSYKRKSNTISIFGLYLTMLVF